MIVHTSDRCNNVTIAPDFGIEVELQLRIRGTKSPDLTAICRPMVEIASHAHIYQCQQNKGRLASVENEATVTKSVNKILVPEMHMGNQTASRR